MSNHSEVCDYCKHKLARVASLEALYAALLAWKADQRSLMWRPVEACLREIEQKPVEEKGE